MKYTSPIYTNEAVETADVICSSMYSVKEINKVVGKDSEGNDIIEPATQITVSIGNLF